MPELPNDVPTLQGMVRVLAAEVARMQLHPCSVATFREMYPRRVLDVTAWAEAEARTLTEETCSTCGGTREEGNVCNPTCGDKCSPLCEVEPPYDPRCPDHFHHPREETWPTCQPGCVQMRHGRCEVDGLGRNAGDDPCNHPEDFRPFHHPKEA